MTMRLLVATDAWRPQVNGVVQTFTSIAPELARLGVATQFLTPQDFRNWPMPGYPEIRLAWPRRAAIAERLSPAAFDAVHIATEGPIGWAVRAQCLRLQLPFTTSFHTRFPEYLAARVPVPPALTWAALRRFHRPARAVMTPTRSMMDVLAHRGFDNVVHWSRGVNLSRFRTGAAAPLPDYPRPIFLSVGRLAREKNLDAFLSLKLPGTKLVIGDGPDMPRLMRLFPDAVFLGGKPNEELAGWYAAADVFVFPSLTDTFGLVLIEALACGLPVAAFPVPGPLDVIGDQPVGVLSADLREAALGALRVSREMCRSHAERFTWAASAAQFRANVMASLGMKVPCSSEKATTVEAIRASLKEPMGV